MGGSALGEGPERQNTPNDDLEQFWGDVWAWGVQHWDWRGKGKTTPNDDLEQFLEVLGACGQFSTGRGSGTPKHPQ